MIWLIGNRGMLGRAVESLLLQEGLAYAASDQEVDIANFDDLRGFSADKSISWIINCAAYTAVDKAEDEPTIAFRVNAVGPENIARIAKQKGAKLIHISTDYVFDGTKTEGYVESDPPNPLGVYGMSKCQGEVRIAETLGEFFIIRTAWLFGREGNNFVYTMLRLFNERDEVQVVGDQWGSPTYAPDLAAAILVIIRFDSSAYGIYHFSNDGRISWYDFACEICRNAQANLTLRREVVIRRVRSVDYPTKTLRPASSYLSSDKFTNTFNVLPRNWKAALGEFMLSGIR